MSMAAHETYFAALQDTLRREGPMRPCLLIDLDRLDRNIERLNRSIARSGKALRLVEKSLPSLGLLDYVATRTGTRRLMSFHQPFLSQDAARFRDADLLLGKPLPVAAAAHFYRTLRGGFDPARRLQWLIDTPQRLAQYLELARGLGTPLRISIEIDVGLHRGGVETAETLAAMLKLIAGHAAHLQWSGFMGYDPHVVAVPGWLASRRRLLADVLQRYGAFVEQARRDHTALWRDDLVFNTAGSPSFGLHESERISNELSVGSALLKPADFDLDTLSDYEPAAFIATPVLKTLGPMRLPGLRGALARLPGLPPWRRQTVFIYGGNWLAAPVSPPGLRLHALYGRSANQELLSLHARTRLAADDRVFLRPRISEAVLLQFGDLLAVRRGRIEARWPVLENTPSGP